MNISNEEKKLLEKLKSGILDGRVGDSFPFGPGSTSWHEIRDGVPARYRKGPGGKFYNGKENERYERTTRTTKKYKTDDEKLWFLQTFGFLMDDEDVKNYSKKNKP